MLSYGAGRNNTAPWLKRIEGGLSEEEVAEVKELFAEIVKTAAAGKDVQLFQEQPVYINTRKEAGLPYRKAFEGMYNHFEYIYSAESINAPYREVYFYLDAYVRTDLFGVVKFYAHDKYDHSIEPEFLTVQDITDPSSVDTIVNYIASNMEEAIQAL